MSSPSSRDTLQQLRQHMARLYGLPVQLSLLAALLHACQHIYGQRTQILLHWAGLPLTPAGDDASAWLRQLLDACEAPAAGSAPGRPAQALTLARIEVRTPRRSVILAPCDPMPSDDWSIRGAPGGEALQQAWQQAAATLAQTLEAESLVELSRALGLPPAAKPQPALYLVHGADGSAAPFAALAARLDCRVFAFNLRQAGRRQPSIQALAAHYVRRMLSGPPAAAYRIGGHSFGAIVAAEMATILRSVGKQVDQVVLLDPSLAMAARDRQSDAGNEMLTLYLALHPEMTEQQVTGHMDADELAARIAQRMPKGRIDEVLSNRHACLALLQRYRPTPGGADGASCLRLHARQPFIASWNAAAMAHRQPGIEVPGNHFSMLAEPHAGSLAQLIQTHRESNHDHSLHS
ncbi:alpha/beta fold hydrolase [Janthinobacterium rivuli]|uniref:Alpha/beta fold hydrolase n=1 Tax=Janthinobacterium rivuli TaxID=2751478 RepID=A0ABY8I210_9BURK|nr:thioesterase domain-containing protein [Janthinobacterium rivuli]WFR78173.1 alpha/beta fold hydrolase [Janthinobacterium rivuli]